MNLHLFALQVFLPLPKAEPLRQYMQNAIISSPENASPTQKVAYYRAVCERIAQHQDDFEMGVWDFMEDSSRAQAEFDQWCKGTVEDATSGAPPDANPQGMYRQSPGYMFATLLFLVRAGSNSDDTLRERCRMPDSEMWRKSTFSHLLRGISLLNFASVRSDAIYMRPYSEPFAVTQAELGEEHYEYLKRLG
jgi:hypothetical protein